VKPTTLLPALALASLALAGCGGSETTGAGGTRPAAGTPGSGPPSPAPRLIFVPNNSAGWWNAVEKGMQDGGEEFGARVEMRRHEGTVQTQVEKLREVLALDDVQGVAVSATEADAVGIADAMRDLQKAGKVVIIIDADLAPEYADARSGYIGTRNENAGRVAGKAAAILRPQGGDVAVFVGTSGSLNARQRSDGFFEGAGAAFRKIETFEDGTDLGKALQNAQDALVKNPDLGVLLGLWAYNAPILAEELAKDPERRKRTHVVTFDLDEAAVPAMEKGQIDASVVQNPYEMGRQGVKLLKALIQKDQAAVAEVLPDGQSRDTGVRVVVPSTDSPLLKGLEGQEVITIDEMKSWLESKGLKSS
jgi:ribose transport system substrate-binding protein